MNVHTVAQVVVGAGIGVAFALIWNLTVNAAMSSERQATVLGSSLCRSWRIRDSSHIADLVAFEYDSITKAKSH
jgi:hypothetical protein